MSPEFYRLDRHHYIYAIMSHDDPEYPLVFVGKTYSKSPKNRYYAHLKGENVWTKDDFGPGENQVESRFLVLEAIDCPAAVAYRHVVAWCKYFEDNGYVLLNAPGTCRDTEYLLPETQMVFDEVCWPVSLDEVLTRDVVDIKPVKSDSLPSEPPVVKPQKEQMCLRMDSNTAGAFRRFCGDNEITQNEAMRRLLCAGMSAETLPESVLPWQELQNLKDCIKRMKEENKTLHKACSEIRRDEQQRRKELIGMCEAAIRCLLDKCTLPKECPPPIKARTFRFGKANCQFDRYHYPTEAGTSIVKLQSLVYGKGRRPALFLLSETVDGEPLKLRYYPKPDYIGLSVQSGRCTYEDAEWIVGYKISGDGAADLMLGLPLDIITVRSAEKTSDTDASTRPAQREVHKEATSLDQLILQAEGKRQIFD